MCRPIHTERICFCESEIARSSAFSIPLANKKAMSHSTLSAPPFSKVNASTRMQALRRKTTSKFAFAIQCASRAIFALSETMAGRFVSNEASELIGMFASL